MSSFGMTCIVLVGFFLVISIILIVCIPSDSLGVQIGGVGIAMLLVPVTVWIAMYIDDTDGGKLKNANLSASFAELTVTSTGETVALTNSEVQSLVESLEDFKYDTSVMLESEAMYEVNFLTLDGDVTNTVYVDEDRNCYYANNGQISQDLTSILVDIEDNHDLTRVVLAGVQYN